MADYKMYYQSNSDSISILEKQLPLRATKHLNLYGNMFPQQWKKIDKLKEKFGDAVPDWCFFPMEAPIWDDGLLDGFETTEVEHIKQIVPALASWRASQGVYRFDPLTIDAVWNTPINSIIPVDVLNFMPELCVYVETGDREFSSGKLKGFFACFEYIVLYSKGVKKWLKIVLDIENKSGCNLLLPFHFPMKAIDTQELTIETMIHNFLSGKGLHLKPLSQTQENVDAQILFNGLLHDLLPGIFSMMLYICSINAEMKDCKGKLAAPAKMTAVKTKKGMKHFPPGAPTVWDTAWRIGGAIRAANANANSSEATGMGGTVRPHVRRAHWHTFWTGPISGPRFTRNIWIPPISVKVNSPRELIAAVRKVALTAGEVTSLTVLDGS